MKEISGNIVNLIKKNIYPGKIKINNGKIKDIKKEDKNYKNYIIPGFVDSHIHIESSMLTPVEFSRIAAIHGTIGLVSDPHEIANVMGIKGIDFMIKNASKTPVKFYFGVPSCVPSSPFETTGCNLDSKIVKKLLKRNDIKFLAEFMNYPGLINKDPEVMEKIKAAKSVDKPIDGHAPGLSGEDLRKYIKSGISTDHECFTLKEAKEKISHGMKILIREGSAARNFDELVSLLENNWENCMFCSDDKHPDDLSKGHINLLVKRAVEKNIDPLKVLTASSFNPIKHYNLDIGLLQKGDSADFLIVDDLQNFNVLKTYIDGIEVAEKNNSNIKKVKTNIVNNFNIKCKKTDGFKIKCPSNKINIIEVKDGQLITEKKVDNPKIENGYAISDVDKDILKIVVVNRYKESKPSIGFIKNFGLKNGAIASSVAHDSHNIICVGVNDKEIYNAVNLIIENKGGICAVNKNKKIILPLPIAGIISDKDCNWVSKKYTELDSFAKHLGSKLQAPFMSLSFMGLTVIPKIKLSDKGLFDSEKFEFINTCM